MSKLKYLLFVVFLACGLQTAKGELVYEVFLRVGEVDLLDGTAFSVLPRDSVTATAVFRETATDGSTAILSDRLLGSVGLSLSAVGADGLFENAERDPIYVIEGVGDISGASFGSGLPGDEVRPGVFEVVFGSVDLIAPSTLGATTEFRLADSQPDDGRNNWGASGSGPQINDSDIRFQNFQITAIPEPSGLAFLALMGGGLMIRRRRRSH
ncbi:MAG: PEP-CTERM sorting domain-containing protein [Planctomycetota bacterium]